MSYMKGPWKAESRDSVITSAVLERIPVEDFGIVIWVPYPRFALGATGAVVCTANIDSETAWANARIMAAAPELLEALKWVLKEGYANEALDCGDHCSNACMWCAVRNAIEKAEGREP